MLDIEVGEHKKTVERKKHLQVVNILKKSLGTMIITNHIWNFEVNLTIDELLILVLKVQRLETWNAHHDFASSSYLSFACHHHHTIHGKFIASTSSPFHVICSSDTLWCRDCSRSSWSSRQPNPQGYHPDISQHPSLLDLNMHQVKATGFIHTRYVCI